MKGKEQLLDFLNITFGIIIISLSVYYFTVPGNFEKFQDALLSFIPFIIFAATLIIKIKLSAREATGHGEANDSVIFVKFTYWGKMMLEVLLIGLPIFMSIWIMFFNLQSLHSVGLVILVYLINLLALHLIFNKK